MLLCCLLWLWNHHFFWMISFLPNISKHHERNVRYIKGGLLRKGGYLANVDGGPKKQHFPACGQKFYFALVRINSQKFAHLKT